MAEKILIITEKPSVARDFANALSISPYGKSFFEGNDHVITWAIGHLLTPLDPDNYDLKWKKWSLSTLPIIPERLLYRSNTKTKGQLKAVINQLRRADIREIIVATDAGREGELIARTIIGEAKVRKIAYRFWTSQALTKEVILSELGRKRPLHHYDRLYIAGKARQFADWLVGMNLTRLATLKMGELFSVGRVQTAVLALLVSRRKEIDQFVATSYWRINVDLLFENGPLSATWFDPIIKDNTSAIDNEERAKTIVREIMGESVSVRKIRKKDVITSPPHLFSLTELQREANKLYGLSAKKTLDIAQKLYEKHKCISYPRTDSSVMGESSLELVQSLYNLFSNVNPSLFQQFDESKLKINNKRLFDDSKLTDHHALIPLKPFGGSMQCDDGKIFSLILKRFAMALSFDHESTDTSIRLKIGAHNFKTKGSTITKIGWKSLGSVKSDRSLPVLSEGETGEFVNGVMLKKMTLPPLEYSESMLLKDMTSPARLVELIDHKKLFRGQVGIGTQATRAQIIETLIERGYIVRSKRSLIALPKGTKLIDKLRELKGLCDLTGASETAKWELELEEIASGNGNGLDFVNGIKEFVRSCIAEWK